MVKQKKEKEAEKQLLDDLVQNTFLFRGLDTKYLQEHLNNETLVVEKLFSNRPIYTAFMPDQYLDVLYVIVGEGLVINRSTPLDRIVAINYAGSCFGMRSLPLMYGLASRAFPCLVEAYKTTHVIKIPLAVLERLYEDSEIIRERYRLLFELGEKFQYHLLNCSSYPPQAVASLLRALIYQERELKNLPNKEGIYLFDLPIDVIARACQLNQRTVEQVLKGMQQIGLVKIGEGDLLEVVDPEGLKEVYSTTRDKVNWWPLR
jgi:hypothetical protein